MNILTIGGSGAVGRVFVERALKAGHSVTVLSRGIRPVPAGAGLIVLDRDRPEEWDVLPWDGDPASRSGLPSRPAHAWDVVIDFMGRGQKHAVQMLGIDSMGIRNIFVSSDLVYSPRQTSWPLRERESRYQTRFFGGEKYQTEWMFNSGSSKRSTVVVRPSCLYGPGLPLGWLPRLLADETLVEKLLRGDSLPLAAGGFFFVQPLFVDDFADLLLALVMRPDIRARHFNVCGPELVEVKRMYEVAGELLGVRARIEEVPVKDLIQENPAWEQYMRNRYYSTSEIAATGLALPATGLEVGMARTLGK